MRTVLYILCQCTWGLPQTLLGFLVFLAHVREKHYFYHGAIITGWKSENCASLGMFVFMTDERYGSKGEKSDLPLSGLSRRLLIHEYGHTIQSLLLGPLYLVIIGIPSALWYLLPYYEKKRRKEQISYFSFFPEKWADHLGAWALEKKSGNPG